MFHVFFCLFCVLKKRFLILFHSPFFVLLFSSVSLLYSIFMYPKFKNVVAFLAKTLEKLSFLFLISRFKNICVREKIRYVCIIFEIVLNLFSLRLKTTKITQKNLFLFLFSLFLFHFFFQHFSSSITVVFVHLLLSSFCSSLSAFLTFFFSLFSPFFLFLHFNVSLFFLCLVFPFLFFLDRRFCVSSFCFHSFFFSLFCS